MDVSIYGEFDAFEPHSAGIAVMTTCLLDFLVSLRVLNLMAMFDTMSGPLSRHHVAQRQVVAALFANLSCED